MNDPLRQLADQHFQTCCGLQLDALTAPLGEANPAGPPLRGGPLYREIAEARREDDPTLPLGPWAYELKRADWPHVIQACAETLAYESKDLQLCAWLLEAQIHHYGLEGVAPTTALIAELCERYWEHLHPRPEGAAAEGGGLDDDTLEARANLFDWINEKLLPALRLVPLTAAGHDRRDLCWADWEQAARNEQLRLKSPQEGGGPTEGATLSECATAMASTPTEIHLAHHHAIAAALSAIDRLQEVLDRLGGREPPTLSSLRGLLDQLRLLVEGEMKKRGLNPGAASWHGTPADPDGDGGEAAAPPREGDDGLDGVTRFGSLGDIPQGNRAAAYAVLAEVAELLGRIEPHSPVPALLRRAVEWGTMNTRELYEELFLRLNGQLNIFELLGVEFEAERQPGPGEG